MVANVDAARETGLRRRALQALLGAAGVELCKRAVMVVVSIATARALAPAEVGILGLAVLYVEVVSMIGSFVETACVTGRSDSTDAQYATTAVLLRVPTTAVLLVLALAALPMASSWLAGAPSSAAQLGLLVMLLMWQPVVETAAAFPRVLLQRRLDLTYLNGVTLMHVLLYASVSVALLSADWGGMGVVAAALIATFAAGLALWIRVLYRSASERRVPSGGQCLEMLRASLKLFTGGFVGYVGSRVDNVIVAAVLGPAAMGFYAMAWNASRLPVALLDQLSGAILVPILARIRHDAARVEHIYREVIRHSYVVIGGVIAVVFAAAPALVESVLGDAWLPIVPLLRVMMLVTLTAPLTAICRLELIVTGRAQFVGLASGAQLVLLCVLVPPLASSAGVLGAAIADLLAVIGLTVVLAIVTGGIAADMIRNGLRYAAAPVLATAATIGLSELVSRIWAAIPDAAAIQISLAVAGYILAFFVIGDRSRLTDFARAMLDGLKPKPGSLDGAARRGDYS